METGMHHLVVDKKMVRYCQWSRSGVGIVVENGRNTRCIRTSSACLGILDQSRLVGKSNVTDTRLHLSIHYSCVQGKNSKQKRQDAHQGQNLRGFWWVSFPGHFILASKTT